MNHRNVLLICMAWLLLLAPIAQADVKTERRTKLEFPGVLGGLMKTFGGKGAREGVVSKIALKGDRKMSVNDDTAELVDLAQEKIYQIDLKNKSYTVRTFEEVRRQMEDAIAKAKAQAAKEPAPKPQEKASDKPQEKPPEFTVDVKIKESGEKKTLSGYNAREVVATITVYEKDKKPEDGSMVLTSSMWLAPRIAALKELEEFDLRLAQKLYLPFAADMAQQMAPAMGMYPGLKEAMGKMETEKVNMDGTTVLTVMRAEAVANPNQNAQAAPPQQNKQAEIPRSLGGLLGGLGRKAVSKDDNKADAGKPASFMTINEELLSVSTTVADADVAIPAGFKEKK